ncbi:MAG: response regulator transcription factor [Chloroflexi bacterium]|nr:response regulator transcription factor [Chloroflexota bacterium]
MEKIRVLIADDHPVLREGMRQILEKEPDLEVVDMAGDGEEAVRLAEESSPDVVLMDIVMPRLSGIEATRGIKKVIPSTAVLPLTAYDDERYVVGLLEAGAAGYLLKNATSREIIEAIRTVHSGESVLHPAATARLLSMALHSQTQAPLPKAEAPLTERELEILKLAARGMGNKEIAMELGISVPTVKAHLVNIFNRMGVGSRTEAVLQALRKGWVKMDTIAPGTSPSSKASAH